MEPYLDLVQSYRYRKAISSIKNSSHTLAVEYGRHHNIPQNMRLCHTCYIVEDEMYFITICKINQIERGILVSSRKESQCGYTPLSFNTIDGVRKKGCGVDAPRKREILFLFKTVQPYSE